MRKITASLLVALPLLSATAFAADDASVCNAKEYDMGLRFQQQSGEVMALQLQAYQLATQNFIRILANHQSGKKPAVVLDLDETVLDNSTLLVRDVNNCHDYTSWDTWSDWEKKGHPRLIPGAKDFVDFVTQQGVKIFYVSNRYNENKADTLKTLNELHLPQVASDNVLLYTGSKKERRDAVRQNYDIIMLLGDSLPDFTALFKNKKPANEQRDLVAQQAKHFGNDWIVLPNASYGSWTHATLKAWDEKSAK